MDTSVTWQVQFRGSGEDVACCVQQTAEGGYILIGRTNSYSAAADFDLWLIKTNGSGDEHWSKTFGGAEDDFGYSGQQTSEGGYILTGSTRSYGAGQQDVYLIKTDTDGKQEWYKTFGGSSDDCGYSVQCTSDGGYIITGYTFSFGAGAGDVYLIKTNSSGDLLWSKTFGESNYQELSFCVHQTADGGYVIAGMNTDLNNPLDDDAYLVKTYADGNKQWSKIFGLNDLLDGGTGAQQTSDGGYIMCGYTHSFGAGDFDVWLIKTDASGSVLWSRTFGGGAWDRADAIQQTFDGGFVVTGMTRSNGPWGEGEVWLVKTDNTGIQEWSKFFGGKREDWGLCVQQTADKGYILAGKTNSFGAGDMDAYLIYYKP